MFDPFIHTLKREALAGILAIALVTPAIANQSGLQIPTTGPLPGLTLVNDTNAALQTLATLQSGGSAPTAVGLGLSDLKGVLWHDTNTNQIKIRNQADTAWIPILTIDETNNVTTPVLSVSASLSNQTVGATNHPAAFVSLAATTYTLNQTTTLPAGSAFSVFAQAGNVTVAINGADKINGGSAGVGMVIPIGYASQFKTDGAGNWWVTTEATSVSSASIASASTTDIGSLGTPACTISGTTTITGFGATAQAGQIFFCTASGAFQLTYNATSMILNTGGANYTTASGDRLIIKALGSGNFEVTAMPAGGNLALARLGQVFSGGATLSDYSIGVLSSGTTVLDAGNGPSQWLVNNGSPILAAPAASGEFDVLVVNGPSASSLTFSNFFIGSNTGDPYATTARAAAACTITISSPGVFSWTAHGLPNNWPVYFSTTGGLPASIVSGTVYYITAATTNTFEVSATPGGAPINTSGSQSGTHTCSAASEFIVGIADIYRQPTYRIAAVH